MVSDLVDGKVTGLGTPKLDLASSPPDLKLLWHLLHLWWLGRTLLQQDTSIELTSLVSMAAYEAA